MLIKNSAGLYFRVEPTLKLDRFSQILARHVQKLGDFSSLKKDLERGLSDKENLFFCFLPDSQEYITEFEKSGNKPHHNKDFDFYDERRRLDVRKGLENWERLAGQIDCLNSAN